MVHCCVGSISVSWIEVKGTSGSVLEAEALYPFCAIDEHQSGLIIENLKEDWP